MFHKDFSDKLRSSILASEVVGKKVILKQRGKEFTGLCPFHNEKTPSFTVNDQKGFYHCFGCQEHGDIIGFVMKSDGMDFKSAVICLANDFGIEIPKIETHKKNDKSDRYYLLLEKSCVFFEHNFHTGRGDEALKYLKKRAVNFHTIKKFRLGFANNSFDELYKFLLKEGFSRQEIADSGIISKNDQNNLYDRFRNRIVFPITDKKNRITAFGGRVLSDDLPKYLNSSETENFKKNKTLYNFFYAKKPIFEQGFAILVEGYFDVISLNLHGVENVVAGLGTAIGENQINELFLITNKIIVCLDGDFAGVRAAKRISDVVLPLINSKKNIYFAFLPEQTDPDDFIKKFGKKSFDEKMNSAKTLSETLLYFALSDFKLDKKNKVSAEEKAKLENFLIEKTDLIKDGVSKKYFSMFFKDALFKLGKGIQKNITTQIHLKKTTSESDIIAKNIVILLTKFPELSDFQDETFDIKSVKFTSDKLTDLKDFIINKVDDEDFINTDEVLRGLENSDFTEYFSEIKNTVASISNIDLESAKSKLCLLLLKELLIQVHLQYEEALSRIDEIETHSTEVFDKKIQEIFSYKNSIEQKILVLENDYKT
jgi:DNA primase